MTFDDSKTGLLFVSQERIPLGRKKGLTAYQNTHAALIKPKGHVQIARNEKKSAIQVLLANPAYSITKETLSIDLVVINVCPAFAL